ncbi:MAG: hypothetical protein ACE5HO_01010 [bacterium]
MRKYLWIFVVVLLPVQSSAQSISARFATSFYSWERQVTDSTSKDHLRLYQTGQLTIGKLAGNRLSLHLYSQVSQDLAEDADGDPIPRLYNAYFQWQERKGLVQKIKLGRQRIYSGVAYGTIDGIDLTLRAGKLFKVGGFVGYLVPFSNEIEADNWNDSHAFGVRASTNKLFGSRILISFLQRNRRPAAYLLPGRFTQRVLSFKSLDQRLVGVDFYRSFSRQINLYGRFDYDIEQERVRKGQIELRVAPTEKLQITGEFFHRAPLIEANSIFAVFNQNTTQDIGLHANYRFQQNWSLNGNFGLLLYDGDETVRFGVGLRCKYGSLGYNFRRGFGGENNGVYAAFNYPLTAKLGLLASTGFSRYSLFDEDASKNTSLTGSFGFNYRPHKHFSVDFLGQGLRNRFLSNDFRFFVKANYWVFKTRKP